MKFLNKVKYRINQLAKKGLRVDKVLDGKSIEQIASNKRSYDAFEKRYKREIERPKILQEVKRYDTKVRNKKQRIQITLPSRDYKTELVDEIKRQKKEIGKDKYRQLSFLERTRDMPQFVMIDNIDDIDKLKRMLKEVKANTLKDALKQETSLYSDDFKERYFQELSLSPVVWKRVERLFDFLEKDFLTLQGFGDAVVKRNEMEFIDTDKAREMGIDSYTLMLQRLEYMEKFAITNYGYKLSD